MHSKDVELVSWADKFNPNKAFFCWPAVIVPVKILLGIGKWQETRQSGRSTLLQIAFGRKMMGLRANAS